MNEASCRHFDVGGEKNPAARVSRVCRRKKNYVSLSHWDWDHIGFLSRARKLLPNLCIETAPTGKAASPRKERLIEGLRLCPPTEESERSPAPALISKPSPRSLQSNELSHVFVVQNEILIPGDSTARQEKVWSEDDSLHRVRFLLLGHHGSRTSTSPELLARLPALKTAVASARFAKYGHPHQEVKQRLKHHHIPLLKTEDWGNLWFELRP